MPSPLKRPSLVRLLASLCPPPSRASSFPVQTGFPTSLADLVVRNHGRLRRPRKTRRPAALALPPSSVAQTVEVADEPPLLRPTQPRSPVGVKEPQGERAAFFRLRPELLALGGTVALALLALWSEGTVAALTVAAVSLLWIESVSTRRRQSRRPPPAVLASCGGGPVSPIRGAEEAPRSSCSDSDKGSEPPSPPAADMREVAAIAGGEPTTPKRKAKRLLRRIVSKKLQRSKDSSRRLDDGEAEHPETAGADAELPVLKTESLVAASESESSIERSSSSSESVASLVDRRGPGVRFPLSAFVPVILAGLAAGKLPATALAVLCVAFFSGAAQRL